MFPGDDKASIAGPVTGGEDSRLPLPGVCRSVSFKQNSSGN
jgi:hypothetical protein